VISLKWTLRLPISCAKSTPRDRSPVFVESAGGLRIDFCMSPRTGSAVVILASVLTEVFEPFSMTRVPVFLVGKEIVESNFDFILRFLFPLPMATNKRSSG